MRALSNRKADVGETGPRYIVLLGPPGVGKGTQAERLTERLSLPHVASGDLFRQNLKAETALGLQAKTYMDRGALVPDDITIAMVVDRLAQPDCAAGALLDGFPRTVAQAQALEDALAQQGHALETVLYIDAPADVLLARLGGRWTCRQCGAVYHLLFSPPRVAGRCDECGGELYQRADDTPETHRRRIAVYQEQTAPLVDWYKTRDLLTEIDGTLDIDGMTAALVATVEA
ncbi:MAG: adenylate kinase [Chloroflexi bacterium]|nr:adenylate kinase [Chloroflexota bacterium]MBU1750898.1 adenylate kinase [Chloroflexota bacterium]MBU1879250.1 adenylate kinase [Chloroflexota bacterium]